MRNDHQLHVALAGAVGLKVGHVWDGVMDKALL
jgi:hypothetical protein